MRASAALQATWQRTRRPRTWGAALLFGALWHGGRALLDLPAPGPLEAALPPMWVVLALVVAPAPWQWSGDAAPMASTWRGILQALPSMGALTLGVLVLLGPALVPFPAGRGMGPGRLGRPGPHGGGPPPSEAARPFPIHPRLWAMGLTHLSLLLLLGWVLAEREGAELREAAARQAAQEAQARVLQGQMSPHVLFNAISGLTELVREDPVAAEAALVNLADLLRALLAHGARLRAPLGEERRLVALHLALERLRLGTRLRESWDWPEDLDALEVPPLMIQPLIENALKHGVARAVGGGELKVQVRQEGDLLFVCVANTGPAPSEGESTGMGLRNLRERLALLGARADALRLGRDGDWTLAELKLRVRP